MRARTCIRKARKGSNSTPGSLGDMYADNYNGSGSQENAGPWLPDPLMRLCLHYLEGFVHRNLATTLQNGAASGHLGSRVQRIRLNNGVPTG
jgi:hypothetical protein